MNLSRAQTLTVDSREYRGRYRRGAIIRKKLIHLSYHEEVKRLTSCSFYIFRHGARRHSVCMSRVCLWTLSSKYPIYLCICVYLYYGESLSIQVCIYIYCDEMQCCELEWALISRWQRRVE